METFKGLRHQVDRLYGLEIHSPMNLMAGDEFRLTALGTMSLCVFTSPLRNFNAEVAAAISIRDEKIDKLLRANDLLQTKLERMLEIANA